MTDTNTTTDTTTETTMTETTMTETTMTDTKPTMTATLADQLQAKSAAKKPKAKKAKKAAEPKAASDKPKAPKAPKAKPASDKAPKVEAPAKAEAPAKVEASDKPGKVKLGHVCPGEIDQALNSHWRAAIIAEREAKEAYEAAMEGKGPDPLADAVRVAKNAVALAQARNRRLPRHHQEDMAQLRANVQMCRDAVESAFVERIQMLEERAIELEADLYQRRCDVVRRRFERDMSRRKQRDNRAQRPVKTQAA